MTPIKQNRDLPPKAVGGRSRVLGVKVMQASLCTTLTFTDSTSSRTNVRTESGRVESPVVGYAA